MSGEQVERLLKTQETWDTAEAGASRQSRLEAENRELRARVEKFERDFGEITNRSIEMLRRAQEAESRVVELAAENRRLEKLMKGGGR